MHKNYTLGNIGCPVGPPFQLDGNVTYGQDGAQD
jgi:hypothetical protein